MTSVPKPTTSGRDREGRQRAPWHTLASLSRSTAATLIGLALFGVLTRIPFIGSTFYHWDSINFALALEEFDLANAQPHPPGYLLYVLLGRLVALLGMDAHLTLVWISVVASGLAVACLYLLGAEILPRREALAASLLLASSPLFWFYGVLALPHSLDCLVVIFTVWLLYRLWVGESELALPAAIVLGVAGGLRPQTQVFLLPLALYAARGLSAKKKAAAFAGLLITNLAWFVPLILWSGGIAAYLRMLSGFYFAFSETTSLIDGAGFRGLFRNLLKLGMYTAYGWGAGLLPVGIAVTRFRRLRTLVQGVTGFNRRILGFGLIWIAPSLAYYGLVHMGQQGLVFVFLPALLLASAVVIKNLPRPFGKAPIRSGLLGLISINALVFLFMPTFPLGTTGPKILTRNTLVEHDASYSVRFKTVRDAFSPEHAAILSSEWRFPQYYLPEYPLIHYALGSRWEHNEGEPLQRDATHIDPEELGLRTDQRGQMYVIIFDEEIEPFNTSLDRLTKIEGEGTSHLRSLWLDQGDLLEVSPTSFQVVPGKDLR